MLLHEVFNLKTIKIPLNGATKEAAFMELIEAITDAYPELDRNELFAAIIERERKMGTGIGGGAAVPHGYSKGIDNITGAIGISQGGIAYNAPDNKPVHVIFMLVMSKAAQEGHLQILSQIFRLVTSEVYPLLWNVRDSAEARNILSRFV
ncbi:MAG: PTS sugar transporter subunit IIA [Spirochaetaceae bacterium]|jgi:mannitol/fructose-specific phosphotransferase system IIA component (Ntr-type)|nr:PTS sugar transporter subunit IIA [Spirochaetaceae bacterium]